jgi:hypothetical protein
VGELGWIAVHAVLLMGGRNRLAATVNLAVGYLTWRRAPNVNVGDPPEPASRCVPPRRWSEGPGRGDRHVVPAPMVMPASAW